MKKLLTMIALLATLTVASMSLAVTVTPEYFKYKSSRGSWISKTISTGTSCGTYCTQHKLCSFTQTAYGIQLRVHTGTTTVSKQAGEFTYWEYNDYDGPLYGFTDCEYDNFTITMGDNIRHYTGKEESDLTGGWTYSIGMVPMRFLYTYSSNNYTVQFISAICS